MCRHECKFQTKRCGRSMHLGPGPECPHQVSKSVLDGLDLEAVRVPLVQEDGWGPQQVHQRGLAGGARHVG